jgi:hypothetical protein
MYGVTTWLLLCRPLLTPQGVVQLPRPVFCAGCSMLLRSAQLERQREGPSVRHALPSRVR